MAPLSNRKREKTTNTRRKRITTKAATKSGKTATEELWATRRIVTRSVCKKMMNQEKISCSKTVANFVDQQQHKQQQEGDDNPSTTTNNDESCCVVVDNIEEGCTTPKSEKHKIPEIKTCPPAPRKPRISPSKRNFILQSRRPISFFAHPDIDKFFKFAMRNIQVWSMNELKGQVIKYRVVQILCLNGDRNIIAIWQDKDI